MRNASEVPQLQRVMRRCRGLAGQRGVRALGGGGGGRLGESRGRRWGLWGRGSLAANNKTSTNPVIWVKAGAVEIEASSTFLVVL